MTAQYRFVPWSRRGLAATLPAGGADAAPLPAMPKVAIEVVVAGAGDPIGTTATLHGPGSVVGLDPQTIVRTTPTAHASNVEPNYLVAVDFDAPELPWAFTPGGPSASGRLRPWLVLVVVEDRPGVKVEVPAGAPLPRLSIADGAGAELPDLTESWAWAHAQLLDADAGADVNSVGQGLRNHPDRNVSRLVCPRRLRPGRGWIACLVPAFDAGVMRGMGGTPDPEAPVGPAWTHPDAITLPVYFHWTFRTGPEGDFESLARRLKPYEVSATIGRVSMHVGAASPMLRLPPESPQRFLDMDGALRAPAVAREAAQPPVPEITLDEVPTPLREGLREVTRLLADAADGTIDGAAPGTGEAVGPPVYGGAVSRRTTIADTDPAWLGELNLDPRGRVAAGLGAEVMRNHQEELVAACWQQVGQVLEAEAALSQARLSLEASRRFHDRHLVPLPQARLFAMAAPLALRTKLGAQAIPAAMRPTSVPDRVVDPAMRRLASPSAPVVTRAARFSASSNRAVHDTLIGTLARGRSDVDPTRFPLTGVTGFAGRAPGAGLELTLTPAASRALAEVSAVIAALPEESAAQRTAARADPAVVGLVTEEQLATVREVARAQLRTARETDSDRLPHTARVLDAVARTAPTGHGAMLEVSRDAGLAAHPLGFAAGGGLVARTPIHRRNVPVDSVDPAVPVRATVPPPVRDAAVVRRFEEAMVAVRAKTGLGTDPVRAVLVSFPLAEAASVLLRRSDPAVQQPRRLETTVRLAGHGAVSLAGDPSLAPAWQVSPLTDRVITFPELRVPAYRYLAEDDPQRFCPGVGEVPPDSVTLLETNPRFVAAFMAGLNHECGRELLWRGYPTDGRGTPLRRFWQRRDGAPDIAAMHEWSQGGLAAQVSASAGSLVLLLRGDLLRRYPNTTVVAIRAAGPRAISNRPEDLRTWDFQGRFEPDLSFFGFPLTSADLSDGAGWFFAIMEPVTEPRFGFDEEPDADRGSGPASWNDVAWPDLGLAEGGTLTVPALSGVGLGDVGRADAIAAALFQRPFQVIVHSRHLVKGI